MTTETEIANQALGVISARGTIVSMDERSKEASAVRTYYADTRDALLRAAPWNCARRTAYLTLLKALPGTPENPGPGSPTWLPSYPPPPWLYSYYLPDDCVKFRFVIPQVQGGAVGGTQIFSVPSWVPPPINATQAQKFVVGTDFNEAGNEITTISTNQTQAIGVYNRRVTNPDLWDSSFKQAMIDSLACRLAMNVTGDRATADRTERLAKGVMGTILAARTADGNEGLTVDDHTPDWLLVRGYARQWTNTGVSGFLWDTPSFLVG